jgi:HK97 family phage prohead protease
MPPSASPRIVRAKDASALSISKAFEEQRRGATRGFFGPGSLPVIHIPVPSGTMVQGMREAPSRPTPTPVIKSRPLSSADALRAIREHRLSIAGYAAVFSVTSAGAPHIRICPGAFRRAIAARGVYLLLDHPDAGEAPSLASMPAGTLYLEEDNHGLWFEAALSSALAYRMVVDGDMSGVSWGSSGGHYVDGAAGVRIYDDMAIWEVSLLSKPDVPRFPQTWVMDNRDARMRRRYM